LEPLGEINGRQLAELAREFRQELKVLFLAGYAENAVIGNGHVGPVMKSLNWIGKPHPQLVAPL
jgi:hypothetical protein